MVVVEVRERVQTILGPSYLSYHVRRSIGEPRPFFGEAVRKYFFRTPNGHYGHPRFVESRRFYGNGYFAFQVAYSE